MKVYPTETQINFLEDIGVFDTPKRDSMVVPPVVATKTVSTHTVIKPITYKIKVNSESPKKFRRWAIAAAVIAYILIILSRIAKGQETNLEPTCYSDTEMNLLSYCKSKANEYIEPLFNNTVNDVSLKIEESLIKLRHINLGVLKNAFISGGIEMAERFERVQGLIKQLKNESGQYSAHKTILIKAVNKLELIDKKMSKIDQRPEKDIKNQILILIFSLLGSLLFLPILCIVVIDIKEKKKTALEKYISKLSHQTENISINISPPTEQTTPPKEQKSEPSILHPESLTAQIIKRAYESSYIKNKPQTPIEKWDLGVSSIKGNVKDENQDYGICFEIRGHQVIVIADGCGGIPYGALASYLAVSHAVNSIVLSYGTEMQGNIDPANVAVTAIRDAYHYLALKGYELGIKNSRDGLRTTLIIIIANEKEYGYGYIGDGGGYIIRSTGECVKFLNPQKMGDVKNVLAASLGPFIEGQPVIGKIQREKKDFLLVGTDGVFDYVDGMFYLDIIKGAIGLNGDLQKVAEQVLKELSEQKDNHGYICDDNMTLGLMGNKSSPQLSKFRYFSETIDNEQISSHYAF